MGASPAWLGVPRELPQRPPLLAGAAAAAQAVFHGHVYLLGCHSAALSKELFVPAPSLACPDTSSTPFPGDEPRTCSRHAGQGLGRDISSFINVLSFGCLEHTLLLSCLSSSRQQALLPASPPSARAPTLSPISHTGEDVYGGPQGEELGVSSCPPWAPAPSPGLGQGPSCRCCEPAPTRLSRYLNLINTNQSINSNYCPC